MGLGDAVGFFTYAATYVFLAFKFVAPVASGALVMLYSRQFSVQSYRWRKRAWKMDFTESDIRKGQVFAVVVGAGMFLIGVIAAAQVVL